MSSIEALQHFYGNVESAEFKTDRGFQTLFKSENITDQEKDEIQKYVGYVANENITTKRVFQRLSTGNLMISHIREELNTDGLGREGRYSAHTLVIKQEEFSKSGGDITQIWSSVKFCNSVIEAKEVINNVTTSILKIIVDLDKKNSDSFDSNTQHLENEDYLKLVLIALRAEKQLIINSTLFFIGNSEDSFNLIKDILKAVPTAMQIHCTFDSNFNGLSLSDLHYWAICRKTQPNTSNAIKYDIDNHHIDWDGKPETTYEKWVAWMIDEGRREEIHMHREQVADFCNCLEYNKIITNHSLDDEMISYFINSVSEDLLSEMFKRVFENTCGGKHLAIRVFKEINEIPDIDWGNLLIGNLDCEKIMKSIFQSYDKNEFIKPFYPDEINELTELLKEQLDNNKDYWLLKIILAGWTGDKDIINDIHKKKWTEESYSNTVKWCFDNNIGKPSYWIIPVHAKIFAQQYATIPKINDGQDFVKVIKALAKSNNPNAFNELVELETQLSGTQLSGEDVTILYKILKQNKTIPDDFNRIIKKVNKDTNNNKMKSMAKKVMNLLLLFF